MNQEIKNFVKMIVSSSEKRASQDNMTDEQKKDYMYKRLYEHFEKSRMQIDAVIPIYSEAYSGFNKDEFVQYVLTHTSNTDLIFDEKKKIEEKMKKISSRIAEINKKLGTEENLSSFDMSFREIQGHQSPINAQINKAKMKYGLPVDSIESKNGEQLSQEQLQSYTDLIAEMVASSSSVEELYEMAKGQIGFFEGMGEAYEEELRKRSPELFEHIDNLVQTEIGSVLEEKQKLEDEKNKLQELYSGFGNLCNEYDKRLPEDLRGTAEQRKRREEEKQRRKVNPRAIGIRKDDEEDKRRREKQRELEEQRCSSESGCGGGGCSCF